MPTYQQIATDWELWQERVDTGGYMTRVQWDRQSVETRIAIIVECFGVEETPPHEEE